MTYVLSALIGRDLGPWRHSPIVSLPQGLTLVEVDRPGDGRTTPALVEGFYFLTHEGRESLGRESDAVETPVAYVEAEFWAGIGRQGAVVWQSGIETLGPTAASNDPDDLDLLPNPPREVWPINQALAELGVQRGHHIDHFDAINLGRMR